MNLPAAAQEIPATRPRQLLASKVGRRRNWHRLRSSGFLTSSSLTAAGCGTAVAASCSPSSLQPPTTATAQRSTVPIARDLTPRYTGARRRGVRISSKAHLSARGRRRNGRVPREARGGTVVAGPSRGATASRTAGRGPEFRSKRRYVLAGEFRTPSAWLGNALARVCRVFLSRNGASSPASLRRSRRGTPADGPVPCRRPSASSRRRPCG